MQNKYHIYEYICKYYIIYIYIAKLTKEREVRVKSDLGEYIYIIKLSCLTRVYSTYIY